MNINLDPKSSVIQARLGKIKNIIAVSGFKGGVGKSSIASVLALSLAAKGKKTGLLDLDFNGASCDGILGLTDQFPQEIEGLEPPVIGGVKLMTPAFFTQGRAVNFRGAEVSDALLEILAITRWGQLDFLIIDMPPGFGDAAADLIKFIPQAQVLLVKTRGLLSQRLTERSKLLLNNLGVKILGEVENMSPQGISSDDELEAAYGKPAALLSTNFCKNLEKIILPLLNI